MSRKDKLWYAAQATRVVFEPRRLLDTFGETTVHYYVLTEILDEPDKVRIRRGRVMAARPRVITPRYMVQNALDNFGEEAQRYVENVLNTTDGVRIIEYGLQFRKEEYSEETVGGGIDDVADQICRDVQDRLDRLYGVIVGVDDLWEVSLLHFISTLVKRSLPQNARELAKRGLLDAAPGSNVPNAVRIEIESDFRAAEGSRSRLEELGRKLHDYGLFEEYQDRFFTLYRRAR